MGGGGAGGVRVGGAPHLLGTLATCTATARAFSLPGDVLVLMSFGGAGGLAVVDLKMIKTFTLILKNVSGRY